MNKIAYFFTLLIGLLLVGCGGSGNAPTPVADNNANVNDTLTEAPIETPSDTMPPALGDPAKGLMVFQQPHNNGNSFSCLTCHAITENNEQASTVDGLKRPASPLFNAVERASFLADSRTELLDAVNICLTDWMKAPTWQESNDDWLNLQAYLTQESDKTVAANKVTFTQISPLASFENADSDRGKTLFNKTCANCHGVNGLGGDHAFKITERDLDPAFIANKVRTSGSTSSQFFTGLSGGRMPFWSEERLNNTDLNDIIAFVSQSTTPVETGLTCDGNDHPKVGISRTLSMLAHDVSGDVSIVDNCTIEIANFNYDGGGPEVFIYGTDNTSFVGGFSISPQINGQTFTQETYTIKLSSPAVLDTLNGISVWCADFDVSFGDTFFN
ncbi:DM13 domain-containing protein [Algibacillus agarilyticus]|uniref:DM13 domain-containing protein n=1 Tax=Algibacillus agarilyticus TaxID=2234133 RepID=UPI000DCFFAAE|nr:DM13 domain-containing protein [Algibacillus agarilyticus]